MGRKPKQFLMLIVACSATGVVLGGTASWAESNQCWQAESPTNQCLTQNPIIQTFQGMSTGLIAGAGAAIGAAWQIQQKDRS
jgi:hypothetical protein